MVSIQSLHPVKNAGGVDPIENISLQHLRCCGWELEHRPDVGATRKRPGPVEAINDQIDWGAVEHGQLGPHNAATLTCPGIAAADGWTAVVDTWAHASATTITVPSVSGC